MRFIITSAQKTHYQEKGWVEFEELLTDKEREELLEEACHATLGKQVRDLSDYSLFDIYKKGRDLWRRSPKIAKLLKSARFVKTAADLADARWLRMGFDQFWWIPESAVDEVGSVPLLGQVATLERAVCYQNLEVGMLICLQGGKWSEAMMHERELNVLPTAPGNVVMFKGDARIDWMGFLAGSPGVYLLVAYASKRAFYRSEERDWHQNGLKALGYAFGDELVEEHHPTVFR